MCGHYSKNCYNEKPTPKPKPEKLMSPGILHTALHWWSKFSGAGKKNSAEGLKTLCSQPVQATVFTMVSSHQRAWGCHSNVQGPALLKQDKGCVFSLWQWFHPLTHRLPCHLLLTLAAILTVCFQLREGEEKPLWAFGSVQERLMAGERVWTKEPAVSMCCQQSCPDSCCTSCALHVLMAQKRWSHYILKMKDSSCLVTCCLSHPSLLWLPPHCQLSGYSRRSQLIWPDVKRKYKVNSGVGVHSLKVFQSFFMTCLLLDLCCHPRKGQKKELGFQKSNSQNFLMVLFPSSC